MGNVVEGRFADKVALITGAGSGIGRATAIRLAAEGASVFGHDVNGEGLAETAATISAAGGTIETRVGDVTTRAECVDTVAAAVEAFGKLDVLGNVAGIAQSLHVTEMTEEQYRRMVAVNMDAPFFFCQAAIPHLLETRGNIVNIASNAGLMGQAYTVVYCMTKGSIIQMTKSLAMEFVKTPLRVNAIAPGGVNTALSTNFSIPPDIDFDLMTPYMGFRGMAEADEIAALFGFVASDEARSIHGAILSADNGLTAS
jgi:meso-butanediol dehydrogenase/(S,S)-butanediol dehydrogenase/diacetyl reductase